MDSIDTDVHYWSGKWDFKQMSNTKINYTRLKSNQRIYLHICLHKHNSEKKRSIATFLEPSHKLSQEFMWTSLEILFFKGNH